VKDGSPVLATLFRRYVALMLNRKYEKLDLMIDVVAWNFTIELPELYLRAINLVGCDAPGRTFGQYKVDSEHNPDLSPLCVDRLEPMVWLSLCYSL
jgi:hypothetical protein